MAKPLFKRASGLAFKLLHRTLSQAGYRVERNDHLNFFEPLLYRRLGKSPDFFFVQVGANDGVSSDPIRNFVTQNQISGLALEPLKDIFEKLVENYRDYPGVKPVNVALHPSAKSLDLYRVDPRKGAHLGEWRQGIGSFNPNHHTLSDTPEEVMVKETVSCVTLEELLDLHGVRKFDLLQIDTEGFDFEIIKMINFQRWKPAIIRFEHGMSEGVMSLATFTECTRLLMDQGYYIATEPYDAIAYQPSMI